MKKFWKSKTFWMNIIAIAAIIAQAEYGFIIDPEAQFCILGVVNLIIRAVTKEGIGWKNL